VALEKSGGYGSILGFEGQLAILITKVYVICFRTAKF
jgi:hypothetical protein